MRHKVLFSLLPILMVVSCTRVATKRSMVVINPVHYHAALIQKNKLENVSDTVNVYAPEGKELNAYLNTIKLFNGRKEHPTNWLESVHICNNCMDSLPVASKGDFIVLACPNNKKADYILSSVMKGYNVLSDKPMAININNFKKLKEAYDLAKEKGILIYDLMTERYDILNILVRKLISNKCFFGNFDGGVSMSSVHHFFKNVAGSFLVRPEWYYDVGQQGEGITDVTTHLIDLVFWQCFPNEEIYPEDIKLTAATHYSTPITLQQYEQSTGANSFPNYLNYCSRDSTIDVMSNGTISFEVKQLPVDISVRWDFEAPDGSGDTFTAEYKGSKASIKIIQDKNTDFKKQLVLKASEESIKKVFFALKKDFPSLSMTPYRNGSWIFDVAPEDNLSHEEHFNLVCDAFLDYLQNNELPKWEISNTITKYFITTESVRIAQNN